VFESGEGGFCGAAGNGGWHRNKPKNQADFAEFFSKFQSAGGIKEKILKSSLFRQSGQW
jgi:hypothetical protein